MKHAPLLLACLLALIGAPVLAAQEVTAGLSSPSTTVGRPVEIVVTVRGVRSADVPERIDVPGLQIQLFGRSTRFEMHNLSITSTLTYTYSVTPSKTGEFEIPPIEVRVGNKTLRSNPLRLQVADAAAMPFPPPTIPGGQAQPMPPSARAGNGLPFFGDLVLSKKKAYVGEVVPAEVRFYFKTNIGGEVGDRPNLTGEGFTVQRFANVPKREQIVNGENYIVFAFQTAISPAKSGEIEIPAATLDARLQVPGSAPPGFDDFFRNFGGMVPPGMFTNAQDVAVETRPIAMDVVSLPQDGRPEDFSGAIGKFEIAASVSPARVGPGEPVTLRVVVSGQGNFDAMGAPVLTGADEWRSYPPTETFRATDAINFSGEKTYEYLLVARIDQTQTPGVRFTSFDPSTGNYVVHSKDSLPVEALAAKATPTPAESGSNGKVPPATATPEPVLAEAKQALGASSWRPWMEQPWFLTANAGVVLLWVALLAFGLFRLSATSHAGINRRRRRSLDARLVALENTPDADFAEQAVEILHEALQTSDSPLGAAAALEAFDDDTATALRDLLARHDECKYAPGAAKPLDRDSRERIATALRKTIV
jgi:hypothetical protein